MFEHWASKPQRDTILSDGRALPNQAYMPSTASFTDPAYINSLMDKAVTSLHVYVCMYICVRWRGLFPIPGCSACTESQKVWAFESFLLQGADVMGRHSHLAQAHAGRRKDDVRTTWEIYSGPKATWNQRHVLGDRHPDNDKGRSEV